jgi:hypothetical protein
MKKPVNPLYVVKNKDNQIETAQNLIEALFKRIGLDFIYEYFYGLFVSLAGKVKSTEAFGMLIDFLDDYQTMLQAVEKNLKKYGLA